jgi:hypothetical protein
MGKFPIDNAIMISRMTSLLQRSVLPLALVMVRPLVTWLLRSGVGYGEFCVALKPVFLERAQDETLRSGVKSTDSALSLLSGLHRKDVRELLALQKAVSAGGDASGSTASTSLSKATPANQIVTRWLALDLAETLPLSGPAPSFEALARAVSSDTHPRAVLQELVRLGLVQEIEGHVYLQRQAFVPDPQHDEARQLLAGSVADHIAAGVHNLTANDGHKFMEQSVFADGLSADAARELALLANTLWRQNLATMVKAAVPLCERDEPLGHTHRIRLGMYCWSVDEKSESSEKNETDGGTPT